MENVRTTKDGLQYYQDWDKYEGAIVMVNPKTMKLYKALKEERFSLYGKKDSIENLQKAYDNLNERLKNECNPQEVYFPKSTTTNEIANLVGVEIKKQ